MLLEELISNMAASSLFRLQAYATAAGTATGHVFEVTYDAGSHTATWTNLDHNLGDQPITDIALDSNTGDVFVSTDFGVNMLRSGRGAWKVDLNEMSSDPAAGFGGTVSMGRKRYPSFSLLIPYCSSFL